jgi:hypothetical protein
MANSAKYISDLYKVYGPVVAAFLKNNPEAYDAIFPHNPEAMSNAAKILMGKSPEEQFEIVAAAQLAVLAADANYQTVLAMYHRLNPQPEPPKKPNKV